jgi:hypothetical protein
MDKFWINDPKILLDKYWIILPTSSMTRIEQLNTASRLIIYYMALLLLFGGNANIIIFCLLFLSLIVIFYYVYENNSKAVLNDLISDNKNEYDMFTKDDSNMKQSDMNDAINNIYNDYTNKVSDDPSLEVKSGYIDFDRQYELGVDYSEPKKPTKIKKVSYDKNKIYDEKTCRKPTAENPFMNVVFSDYLNEENIPVPCNSPDEHINQEMNNYYNSSIYRSVQDVFERDNSQRNFYTAPIKITPESQTEFANWLYKRGPTCKERTSSCQYFEEPYMTSLRY